MFIHLASPLGPFMGIVETKSKPFIEMPGRVETLKGTQIDLLISPLFAKTDCFFQESVSEAFPSELGGNNEPPKMGPFGFSLDAVNRQGALNPALAEQSPKPVAVFVEAPQEF